MHPIITLHNYIIISDSPCPYTHNTTQELADLLTKTFQQEYLKRKETEFVHNPETDALAGRVREIARTALSMSDMELQEFFEDEASVDHVVSTILVGFYLLRSGPDRCSFRLHFTPTNVVPPRYSETPL